MDRVAVKKKKAHPLHLEGGLLYQVDFQFQQKLLLPKLRTFGSIYSLDINLMLQIGKGITTLVVQPRCIRSDLA